ncbi:MAG: homoserine kinase [Chthoniobacterales bacterium]|nr:homoserine kinase [Chthoniobacterales bacterium]
MKKQQITVRIPATTSNLGPGFDCLGVALQLYNFVTVARASEIEAGSMARQAGRRFFEATACEPFPFSCTVTGEVPSSRGLGSSVTVRLGTLHGLNALVGRPLKRAQIFGLCAELEGHPDNAAPAEFGGFVVARGNRHQKFPVDARLQFILLIPTFEVKTADARRVLPNEIRRRRAVESCGNACLITAAFASRSYENLRGAFTDHLHQPYRASFVPFLDRVIAAGEEAGALGGFLSGSGSTIACLTLRSANEVAAAMLKASGQPDAAMHITAPDNDGARIVVTILNPDAPVA